MSGQDTVRAYRKSAPPPAGPNWLGYIPLVLAVVAIASAGYFFIRTQLAPVPAQQLALADGLTDAELAACDVRSKAAAGGTRGLTGMGGRPLPDHMLEERAQLAGAAAIIACHADTRPERLCEPAARQAFVGRVKSYVSRSDDLHAAAQRDVRPAGTEGGPDFDAVSLTLGLVRTINWDVDAAVSGVIANGYLAVDDLRGGFLSATPRTLDDMLWDAEAGPSRCA